MEAKILPSTRGKIVGVIDPDLNTASTLTTGFISMRDFYYIQFIILNGAMGASATVNFKVEQATDSSGTGVKDISPAKEITQLTQAGTDSDKQVQVNINANELDVDNGFNHVRGSLTVAVASVDSAVVALGFDARRSDTADLATVDEIVS